MADSEMDTKLVETVRVHIANDPEKFSDWEREFSESLVENVKNPKYDEFYLSYKQRAICERITSK